MCDFRIWIIVGVLATHAIQNATSLSAVRNSKPCPTGPTEPDCKNKNATYVTDTIDCNKYYFCRNGVAEVKRCGQGLWFDDKRYYCNYPSYVNCPNFGCVQVTTVSPTILTSTASTKKANGKKPCPTGPTAPDCKLLASGSYHTDTIDCNKYYLCKNGTVILKYCERGLWFDEIRKFCNYPQYVACPNYGCIPIVTTTTSTEESSSTKPSSVEPTSKSTSTQQSASSTKPPETTESIAPQTTDTTSPKTSTGSGATTISSESTDSTTNSSLTTALSTENSSTESTPITSTTSSTQSTTEQPSSTKPSSASPSSDSTQPSASSTKPPESTESITPQSTETTSPKTSTGSGATTITSESTDSTTNSSPTTALSTENSSTESTPIASTTSSTQSTTEQSSSTLITTSSRPSTTTCGHGCPCPPGPTSPNCKQLPENSVVGDTIDCNKYYICKNGVAKPKYCERGLWFDNERKFCNYPQFVPCPNYGCKPNKSLV